VTLTARIVRGPVLSRLAGLRDGCLTIRDTSGEKVLGDPTSPLRATVTVLDPEFWSAVALRGSVGAGEAFMDGHWTVDDLVAVVRILVRNREVMDGMETGLARVGAVGLRTFHALRPNTKGGARRNIADHYDLGNDLFALFLDPTMSYSSGIYPKADSTLEEASVEKVDRLCRKLGLKPEHHLVEIGTGWGYLAVHAASRYGCRVTTTTISKEQHALATERVAKAGLAERVTVLLRDYREMTGAHDRLVSVEMIEAIGHEQFDGYFAACERLLKPGGRAAIQSILIDDRYYDQARKSVDFIRRYVFPGSCIPSMGALKASVSRATRMTISGAEEIGPHYARTLREWRHRFLANAAKVRALGYPDRFLRLWEFYLAYCEGGFEERVLGDAQILLERP
jgi:cyclopropane-fatty-acyl-phospholipid synthase